MFICCNNDYVASSHINDLQIYLNENTLLKEFEKTFNYSISALQVSFSYCVIGLFNGDVILLNLSDKNEHVIHKFGHKVSCIFNVGDFFYFGTDSGKITIFYISEKKEECYNELESSVFLPENLTSDIEFTNTESINYKIVKEIKHNAPIVSIVNDGDRTYILDCKGKITLYGENKGFDISASCMIFCDYLFASENNMLYCKTETAFACRLRIDDEIKYFKFSKLGSVVFLRTEHSILVYNNNTLERIKKIALIEGDFTYNEEKNRLIIFDGKQLRIEEEIIPHISLLSQKMEKIVFAATKIKEKKISDRCDEMEDDLPISKFIEAGGNQKQQDENKLLTRKRKTKNIKKVYSKTKEDLLNIECQEKQVKKVKYVESEESDNWESTGEIENDTNDSCMTTHEQKDLGSVTYKSKSQFRETNAQIHSFMTGTFKDEINDVEMLCYNKIGYVIKHEKIIEVIFHDNENPKKEYFENYNIASVTIFGTLFANIDKLVYKCENEWTKEIANIKLIHATDYIVTCITQDTITFYLPCGLEIYSALVKNPITVCGEKETTVLFCKGEILIFSQNFMCTRIPFHFIPTFCDIESKIVYFVVNKILYSLVNNIFVKMIEVEKNPLCVNNKHLIACNGNVFPYPNVEYYKIEKSDAIYNLYHSTEERESVIVSQIRNCFEKSDFNTSKDLYSLLTLSENRNMFRKIFEKNSTGEISKEIKYNREDAFAESLVDKENSMNLSLKVTSDIPDAKKTKRFNPFAQKK